MLIIMSHFCMVMLNAIAYCLILNKKVFVLCWLLLHIVVYWLNRNCSVVQFAILNCAKTFIIMTFRKMTFSKTTNFMVTLSIINKYHYADCWVPFAQGGAELPYTECHHAEGHHSEGHYNKPHYVEWPCAECYSYV